MAKHHFTHPNHILFEFSDDRVFICNGCDTQGSGKRYRCHACDFNLHEFCINCKHTLSSPVHQHQLHLFNRQLPDLHYTCAVCSDSINALIFYRCENCDFSVHPLCTELPQELHHVIDSMHPLKLQSSSSGASCFVCKTQCSSPCYGCDICEVNIHIPCLLKSQPGSSSSSSTSTGEPLSSGGEVSSSSPKNRGRKRRFIKKMGSAVTTITFGVVSSILYEALGIDIEPTTEEHKDEDK